MVYVGCPSPFLHERLRGTSPVFMFEDHADHTEDPCMMAKVPASWSRPGCNRGIRSYSSYLYELVCYLRYRLCFSARQGFSGKHGILFLKLANSSIIAQPRIRRGFFASENLSEIGLFSFQTIIDCNIRTVQYCQLFKTPDDPCAWKGRTSDVK